MIDSSKDTIERYDRHANPEKETLFPPLASLIQDYYYYYYYVLLLFYFYFYFCFQFIIIIVISIISVCVVVVVLQIISDRVQQETKHRGKTQCYLLKIDHWVTTRKRKEVSNTGAFSLCCCFLNGSISKYLHQQYGHRHRLTLQYLNDPLLVLYCKSKPTRVSSTICK